MSTASSKTNADSIAPAVHLEFIQNQLESQDPSAGQEIERYHRALFLHHHAVELERYRQEAKTREDKIAFLEGQLRGAELGLSKRAKLVSVEFEGQEDIKPRLPWNGWDVSMFAACLLGIIGLVTFGVLNISFNLLESGFITFQENPIRSYFWAALLPVGALGVKIGWDLLKDSKRRDGYLWTCLALGITGVLVWVGAYACVYPTLSKGINDQIASLTVFDGPDSASNTGHGLNFAGAKWVDAVTVAAQAVAEIFLSAVLGIYLTQLYGRHRPVRLVADPAFRQLDQERKDLQESVATERLGLAEATGNMLRLENELSALVAYGRSLFLRELARKTDQQERREVILGQLSEHLRQHLETAERGAERFTPAVGLAASSRKNGD